MQKRAYDSAVRPITAIPFLFRGKTIRAWGGPGKGTVEMDGALWIPYQAAAFSDTPPFPDYVSGAQLQRSRRPNSRTLDRKPAIW